MMTIESIAGVVEEKLQERKARIERNRKLLDEISTKVMKFCTDFSLTVDSRSGKPDAPNAMGLLEIVLFVPCEQAGRKYLLFGPRGFPVTFFAEISREGEVECTSRSGYDGVASSAYYVTKRIESVPEILRMTIRSEVEVIVNGLSTRYNSRLAPQTVDKTI